MKIYVVDNGGQWTHREWRVLKQLGVDSQIVDNDIDFHEVKDADGWVLSGGAPSIIGEIPKLGKISQIIDNPTVPVFGICVGAQFMALHFGGEVRKAPFPEFGKTEVTFFDNGGIFSGIPEKITVWENHNDEITKLPEGYKLAARSKNCGVQAFYDTKHPMFGVQYHPEVENTMFGREIFKSFIEYCRK
ncbi:MAG: GMP synthase subunit A [Candidatus Thermoplasmatota archaeon]|jgi:GMP synthase (glutamine-hydrolysing)|nr:GMP synthase subunit A [Candidatus Thermoplasmatota archaeon]MCL5790408.1 GMP synthase subunit A [Candidatus Thermoplasmatota archaeon]